MFTKDEVNYLVELIRQDVRVAKKIRSQNASVVLANGETIDPESVKEEVDWRLQTTPMLILMLQQHKGRPLNDDEERYLMKLFVEHRQRLSHEVLFSVFKEDQVDEVIEDFGNWFRFGAPAAKKFQDRYLME